MSFSNVIRDELCRFVPKKPCCTLAESYGILAFGNKFAPDEIRIISEHEGFVRHAHALFKEALGVEFNIVSGERWKLELSERDAIAQIYETFGYDVKKQVVMHFHGWFCEEDCCMASFLRGAFLSGGVCADPAKAYHLELASPRGAFLRELLLRISELSFVPHISQRGQNYLLYLKESEQIEDFLTFIGAPAAAMHMMEEKVLKDYRNKINRQSNCEFSNIRKTVDAAEAQVDAILLLAEKNLLSELPDALKETADIRIAFPNATLTELCEKFQPTVSKSCLNHRLRKLMAIAKEIEK
jgi:DNA-binding protein WhiA